MNENEKRLETLAANLDDAWNKLKLDQKIEKLSHLEEEVANPDIWKNPEEAKNKNMELSRLSDEIHPHSTRFHPCKYQLMQLLS